MNHLSFIVGNGLILLGFLLAFAVINIFAVQSLNIGAGLVAVIAGAYLDFRGRGGRRR